MLSLAIFVAVLHPAFAVEVDQIEADGMRVLGVADLNAVLEIRAGEEFDPELVRRSLRNLKELYRYRGFPEAEIQHSWSEESIPRTLKFNIREGRPTRISEVRVLPAREKPAQWEEFSVRLRGLLNLRTGDVFDQEKAAATARLLQSAMQAEEFIGSVVNEVRVDRLDRASDRETASWVALQIRVDLGERVTFGFRGNQYFSRNELLQQILEQRALGLGQDYVETLKARLQEAYESAGFSQAEIRALPQQSRTPPGRHVTWVIKEGSRARIARVEFEGNVVFSDTELSELFFQSVPRMLSNRVYYKPEVDKASEFLIQKLRARGYLGARLMSTQALWDPEHTLAVLQIYLVEGEMTRVGQVEVTSGDGDAAIDRETALKILSLRPGDPFNIYAFNDGVQQLKRWFRNRGFLEVVVPNEGKAAESASQSDAIVHYRDNNHFADVQITVQPGQRFKVSRIKVDGLGKTREWVVRRELPFRPGDVLTEQSVFEGEGNLRRLGLFSSVQLSIEPDEAAPDQKRVIVTVQEGTPGLVAGGLGFRNDLGVRVFGTTSYSNLFGRNHALVFSATANRRVEERRIPLEYQLQLGYLWPWFGWGDLVFRPNVTFQRIQYVNFDASTLALAATWEKKLLSDSNLIAAFNYSLERIEQTAQDPDSIDNQTLTIGAINPSLRLDLRDNPLAPTRGFYGSLSFELADPLLLSQVEPFAVGYTRLLFRSDYTWNFWRDLTWYFSFRTGLERNTQDISDTRVAIPLIKQFALGGAASLRGFREQELNIQDIAVRGTASYVNYRTQLDLPLSGPMRFGPFLDAANLLVDRYSLRDGLRFGTGFGIHYLTPVGPINFDLGFKVAPRPNEESYRFYFSIGMI
ncbi:MAG: POTRA domain-containing protein [Oligoflexia bacterium]